jgi:hypothetical protein
MITLLTGALGGILAVTAILSLVEYVYDEVFDITTRLLALGVCALASYQLGEIIEEMLLWLIR